MWTKVIVLQLVVAIFAKDAVILAKPLEILLLTLEVLYDLKPLVVKIS